MISGCFHRALFQPAILLAVALFPLLCPAQKPQFKAPPHLGRDQVILDKDERRAKAAAASGRLMGNGSAALSWRSYFANASYRARGSDAFLPHAVYGLQNFLHILVRHAQKGEKELAEAVKLLSDTLESDKVNHGQRPKILQRGGAELAALHGIFLDAFPSDRGVTPGSRLRLDLEKVTAYAREAGVLVQTNKTRTDLASVRSDLEAALAIHDVEKAEAKLNELRALEKRHGKLEEPFSSPATLFISQELFKKLVEQASRSQDAAWSAFEALVAFARRQGWPTPENCVDLALALAQYELEWARSPQIYLEEAERWFEQVFPGADIQQAWQAVADAAATHHLESSLTFYLKARSVEQVLGTGETSPEQEAALRMDLAKIALARARVTIDSGPGGSKSARPAYKTAHETLTKQVLALTELLPQLDPSTAESTGVLAFLLTTVDDGPCPDPGSLCEALVQFVQAHPVSEDFTLRATFALARVFVNERPSESARAFELLYPCAQRVLSGYEWQDPQALFYYTAVTAMRSGRWTEATEFLAALKPGAQGSSENLQLWEIALMRVLTLAHAQPGKKDRVIETLESSYQEASIDKGQRHNLRRRLASVYLQDARQEDFLQMMEEADAQATSLSSGSPATGKPWHDAAPMPQPNNEIQGRLLSVPVPSTYLVSRERTEKLPSPSSLTVKALATPKLDLNARYLKQATGDDP